MIDLNILKPILISDIALAIFNWLGVAVDTTSKETEK
jgi:hypothetical protein